MRAFFVRRKFEAEREERGERGGWEGERNTHSKGPVFLSKASAGVEMALRIIVCPPANRNMNVSGDLRDYASLCVATAERAGVCMQKKARSGDKRQNNGQRKRESSS